MKRFINKIFLELSQILQNPVLKIGQTTISLASLLQLIFSFVIVIIICRVFDNLLKNKILVNFGIDEGNREALATIFTYIFGTLGFLIILESTGFNLASLAVLAGGLGIGLGFGIQNITANFLSGLTLLIERSVKVGDVVELWISEEFKTLQGKVKKITLRSTIIQTIDGSSLIIPNSELVQKPILNCTYNQNIIQFCIPVKIEYGNDPLVITEILLDSAYMEPLVILDNPPKVIFNGFANGYLDFELKVWIDQINEKNDIKSVLNYIIEYNLRHQGINLASNKHINEINYSLYSQYNQFEKKQKNSSLRTLLRQVTYFQNFNDLDLRKLMEIGYRRQIKESQILFNENDPGDAFYIILSGKVEVFVAKINKHLTTLGKAQFFGELALMLAIPRTATVRALEDTTLFVINNQAFETFLKGNSELAEEIINELAKHQEELTSRQQQLRQMGLIDESEDDVNPVIWVRKRIRKVFNL
ncbi:MAG: cyclic nucleotide-binding domain-containing protein [Cyanobacteria bacterium P01_D01_bin.50]